MVSIWPESSLQWVWTLLVEIQGDPVRAYEEIGKVFREVTEQEMQARFIDQQVQDSFATQLRLLKIVALFAGVALVISVMGLVAMSMYFIRQRTKEVAICKVFGSESGAVMGRLVWTFLWYGVVGFVIALPLSWVAMERWLSAYSYRIAFSPLYVLAAGLACALVSFLSVFWQSYRAAHADSTRGLRQE